MITKGHKHCPASELDLAEALKRTAKNTFGNEIAGDAFFLGYAHDITKELQEIRNLTSAQNRKDEEK